jgi:hypothetical protein
MSKPKLVQRACCGSGVSRRRGQITPSNVDVSFDIAGVNGPIIAEIEDHQIERTTCIHEAAHAAFAHGFWAAPAAEAAANRCRITLGVDDELDYLNRVRQLSFGSCDECTMALTAWTSNGLDAGIEAARAVFREGQLLALKLLDRRDVRTAISALADKRSDGEIVDSATCHDLFEQHLMFGSLQEPS